MNWADAGARLEAASPLDGAFTDWLAKGTGNRHDGGPTTPDPTAPQGESTEGLPLPLAPVTSLFLAAGALVGGQSFPCPVDQGAVDANRAVTGGG